MKRRLSFRLHGRLPKRPKRKVTGYQHWRWADGYLMRGNERQYNMLMDRK